MPLHPNLHVVIPSGPSGTQIEARIFLPAAATATGKLTTPTSTSARSTPVPIADLGDRDREALRALGLRKVVTAAHPWGRLGGNMMFPVIAYHLPEALFSAPSGPTTVYAAFNVPGVGRSGGSMPWPGCGIGSDGQAFADVEAALVDLVGGTPEVYRVGYSYGTNLALNAPIPPSLNIKRTLLISPAPTLFKAMTLFSGPTFATGVESALDRAAAAPGTKSLWHVFGDRDDFTGVATLRALGGARNDLIRSVEIEGCGHFYAREQDGDAVQRAVKDWIADE